MQRPPGSRPHSPGPCTERDDRPTCRDHALCVLGRSATTGPSLPRTVPQCRTRRAGTTTELWSGTRRHRMAAGRARSTRTEHAVQTSLLRLDERVHLAHRSFSFAKKTADFRSTWFVSACSAAGLRSRRSSSRSASAAPGAPAYGPSLSEPESPLAVGDGEKQSGQIGVPPTSPATRAIRSPTSDDEHQESSGQHPTRSRRRVTHAIREVPVDCPYGSCRCAVSPVM